MTCVSELFALIALNLTKNIYASYSREGFLLLDAKWESVGKILNPNTDMVLLSFKISKSNLTYRVLSLKHAPCCHVHLFLKYLLNTDSHIFSCLSALSVNDFFLISYLTFPSTIWEHIFILIVFSNKVLALILAIYKAFYDSIRKTSFCKIWINMKWKKYYLSKS